jgi:hypothetical protein
MGHSRHRTRLLLLVSVAASSTSCVTPVAVRSLSAQLVKTQQIYSASLHGYFAAVEKFADAEVKIADYRIDEITTQMNREFGRRANAGLAGAVTPDQRQRIIEQLIQDVAANASANLPLKNKISGAVASLKQKDQELEAAYLMILTATEKLDEYIRLKKADEVAIDQLARSVGLNSEKIVSIVDAIGQLSEVLTQNTAKVP